MVEDVGNTAVSTLNGYVREGQYTEGPAFVLRAQPRVPSGRCRMHRLCDLQEHLRFGSYMLQHCKAEKAG